MPSVNYSSPTVKINTLITKDPIPDNLKEKAENYLNNILVPTFEQYVANSQNQQEQLYSNFKDFLAVKERNLPHWRANFTAPVIFNSVRTIFGRIIDAIASAPKFASVKPFAMFYFNEDFSYDEKEFEARLAEAAFNTALDMGKQRYELLMMVLDSLIYGRAWSKNGFVCNLALDNNGSLAVESEYPKAYRISPFNIYKDPYNTYDLHKSRFIFEILEVPYEIVKLMIKERLIVREAFDFLTETPQGTTNQIKLRINNQIGQYPTSNDSGYYEFVQAHCYFDPDENGVYTPYSFLFDKDSKKLLACNEIEYKHTKFPYSCGSIIPVADLPFGLGLSQILHPIQAHASATINQLIENIAAMNMRHLILEDAIDEIALSKSIPNQIIRCQDLNAHKPLQGQGMPADTWRILDFWEGLKQETSAVTPISLAIKAASTAFGTQTLQQNAQANFDTYSYILSLTLLQDMYEQLFSNFQQFQDLDIVTYLDEKDGNVRITSDMIQGKFKITPYDMRNILRRRQRAQDSIALLAQMVQGQIPANYQWIIKNIFEDFELYDVDMAFKGNIWSPALAEQQGVPGQNYPAGGTQPVSEQPTTRLQIQNTPTGAPPADITNAARNLGR